MKYLDDYWAVADSIRYKDWSPTVQMMHSGGRVLFWWQWLAPCVNTGERKLQESRKWDITGFDEEAIVKTAFAAAKMAEEHECAENFNYQGRRIFDPHRSLLA